ncbi:WXG100 family type VII secretion target [Nocardia tengchongensis]|uniref:WXG100 family type VII secretion target n=1 Tax=Nocardia tengchongensis TaxID=2055889 RepID=UPI0036CFD153
MSTDSDGYRTDLNEMRRLIDRATKIETTIEKRLDDIEKRVAALHIQWSGVAAEAHSAAHDRWIRATREMHQALTDLRTGTDRAHGVYTDVVATNRKMWPA